MKLTRSHWLFVTAACLTAASLAAQSGPDRPPGIDENRWIPISATAGIALTDAAGGSRQPTSKRRFRSQPQAGF